MGVNMLFEQINEDIKQAMLKKEKEKLDALRGLKALFIENKTSKSPIAEMDVLINCVKKLKGSLESFPDGHEIKLKTEREIEILSHYMPKQLTSDEVKNIISEIIKNNPGANQGMVMKELTPKIKGQFDGKAASELVKSLLS
jgi:uncharacterized protein YqeY